MADACIVCLGDLRVSVDHEPPPEVAAAVPADSDAGRVAAKQSTSSNAQSIDSDDEAIAHLLPCKHDLHNSCLKPWVERANSCPICRTTFNMVEISRTLGGPVVDSYAVKDKTQEAELDTNLIIEDELIDAEAWEPCAVCGNVDNGHGAMYCDRCDRTVHVFCAGFDDAPEVWYCETCLVDMENDTSLHGMASALRRLPRRREAHASSNGNGIRAAPRRRNETLWARVWQEVSRRLDLDLDFPFDEEASSDQRTEEQRREFQRWQRRFEVASQQGATNRLRDIAQAQLHPGGLPHPAPESQEELRAWNAFDKARESQDAPTTVRRRKRRATHSPSPPTETEHTSEQPQLKRPRLRRPREIADQPETSTAAAIRRGAEEPAFLSSLLREVENKTVSAASPAASDQAYGQQSPRNTSPMRSPASAASSECGSPKTAVTPPAHRPLSPPLSSSIMPAAASPTFSPFSPTSVRLDLDQIGRLQHRGRRRHKPDAQHNHEEDTSGARQSSTSPSRSLSYSTKEEIQRMVKLALGSRYRNKEITKDQYTDINRDVSRKMYDLIHDASALADHEEREKWQEFANDEVHKAITAMSRSPDAEE